MDPAAQYGRHLRPSLTYRRVKELVATDNWRDERSASRYIYVVAPHAARPIGFIEPWQPTAGLKPPSGPGWIHEIKYDGFRMMVLRTGEPALAHPQRPRLERALPSVVEALEIRSCLIEGEVVVCDESVLAVFELLRNGRLIKRRGPPNRLRLEPFPILTLCSPSHHSQPGPFSAD
jgi:ATP-dependent DNA ligase